MDDTITRTEPLAPPLPEVRVQIRSLGVWAKIPKAEWDRIPAEDLEAFLAMTQEEAATEWGL